MFANRLMRSTFTFIAIVAVCSGSIASAQVIEIQPEDGLQHIGETVHLRMPVMHVGKAKDNLVLNSMESWKEPKCFMVLITADAQSTFKAMGVSNLVAHFAHKLIDVTGKVETNNPGGLTRPVIYVRSPEQLRVVNVPGTTAEPVLIKPAEALQYLGKRVRVPMTVASLTGSKQVQNLNSTAPANQPHSLQIRIDNNVQAAFKVAGIENPQLKFVRREIQVVGVVSTNPAGGASIAIKSPDDIQLVLKSQQPLPSPAELQDHTVEVLLRNGRKYGQVRILELEAGDLPNSIAAMQVSSKSLGKRRIAVKTVEDMLVDGVPLNLKYDKDRDVLVVDEDRRAQRLKHDQAVERRTISKGCKIWPWLTDEEQAQWLTTHREFVESVQEQYPNLGLRISETDYYILVTDLDARSTRQYLDYLDNMYEQMSRAFGVPVGRNVWCGKCVVAAFQNQADYMRFEAEVMNNPRDDLHTSGGLCHAATSGRVIIAVWKGAGEDNFAHKLVHETSHGFVWRYLSSVPLPSWLNEGMADWIAEYIVKTPGLLTKRQQRAALAAQQSGTLGGMFQMERLSREYFGAGSAVVDILLKLDSEKFRQFFDGIKSGLEAEEALNQAFGMTFEQLARLYGRTIGMPELKP